MRSRLQLIVSDEFRRLSTQHMTDRLDALKGTEARRASATPSTKPFHDAAHDEKQIAAEIWEHARASDEDTPTPERKNGSNRSVAPSLLTSDLCAGR
jgi:hypothetical protein